jgi:multimeric flavodoxin WrbA
MTILAINASPRRHGNAEILLDKFLEGARSRGAACEDLVLNEFNFRPCQDCGGCGKNGVCVLRDDLSPVFKKLENADCVVLASPVFFGGVSAQLKALIDRFHSVWVRKHILKKPQSSRSQKGVFLCVSGADNKVFFEYAERTVKMFFNTLNMVYAGSVYCGGVENKGDIAERKDVLDIAFRLGADIASGN